VTPPSPERVALASGVELDVLDVGPRDAPVLLFLHGFPESHRTWRHQIAELSPVFRCIAPDQRGYGGSSKPQEVDAYAPDKLIGDVFQLADALAVERFTVIGHDWGGVVAWGAAMLSQGTRVERAVIANAPHPALFQKRLWCDREQRAASQYIRVFRDPAMDEVVEDYGLAGVLAKAFGATALADGLEPGERDSLLVAWQDRRAAFAMLNWYRASPLEVPAMDEPLRTPTGWREAALPRLSISTLVLWGMDDAALPPSNLEGLDALVEDLTIERLPDVGHFTPRQAPEAVNAALKAFLARR
jgi:pimeloyl-ACP methyl ester carboxylesterase